MTSIGLHLIDMPVAAVKYEDLWERAKAQARNQMKEGDPRFWKLVMYIYKQMEAARDRKR